MTLPVPRLLGRAGTAAKRAPLSFAVKVSLAIALGGLTSVVIWSTFSGSAPSSDVSRERHDFAAIPSPLAVSAREAPKQRQHEDGAIDEAGSGTGSRRPNANAVPASASASTGGSNRTDSVPEDGAGGDEDARKEKEEEEEQEQEQQPTLEDKGGDGAEGAKDEATEEEENDGSDNNGGHGGVKPMTAGKNEKTPRPLFDPRAHYNWKTCGSRSGHHYVSCVDMDGDGSRRHHERSCPKSPVTCLVSLPGGYRAPPEKWPERRSKVWYANVAHPKLSAYIKDHGWLRRSNGFLIFPGDGEASDLNAGALQYVDSIDETVPDIDWGKNVRIVLDIGSKASGFVATLMEKNVLVLSLGFMSDQVNLAQVALERGIPAVIGSLGSRRLPFPSGAFDAVHCGDCNIPWHSNGGKLLIEMNRILRPGGFFILSTKHSNINTEEGMSSLMEAICWNVLAQRSDDDTEMSIKVYQRPASNEIYLLRVRKEPPFCDEDQNHINIWNAPIKGCLHKAPEGIEDRGSNWPEEWPARLGMFPDWVGDLLDLLRADHEHWKAVVQNSYLNGLGVDWSDVRNVMDMTAGYGGFAAALVSQKVWVMNVVPVHAPDTLPVIFERGLLGMYHDWCEPFGTYPRTYDMLHADHLFSRLKNRCNHPIVIVIEMDRILRPGGWAIIRDKPEILNQLEVILKSLHWDIIMTFREKDEGLICSQKTKWRP